MKLPIVGDSPPGPAGEEAWPDLVAGPRVVLFDARGGRRDGALLELVREAGFGEPAILAVEGAPQRAPLDAELGPGESIRGKGAALARTVQGAARGGTAAPWIAIGAGAARAFTAPLVVAVDGGSPSSAHTPMARGVVRTLTLRDPESAVLVPLLREALSA